MTKSLSATIRDAEALHGRPRTPAPWQAALSAGSYAILTIDDDGRFGYLALREPPEPLEPLYAFGDVFAREVYDDEPMVVPRARFAYPITADQFATARRAGFPTDAASVNALVGFSRGGQA